LVLLVGARFDILGNPRAHQSLVMATLDLMVCQPDGDKQAVFSIAMACPLFGFFTAFGVVKTGLMSNPVNCNNCKQRSYV
jgi:hypothetical protein